MDTPSIPYSNNTFQHQRSNISLQGRYNNSKTLNKIINLRNEAFSHVINNTNSIETLDTSYINKNTIKDITQEFNPYDTLSSNQKGNVIIAKKKVYSKLDICRTEYQLYKQYESEKDSSRINQSETFFSRKEFINKNNYNNISFKEIKNKVNVSENNINCFNNDKNESLSYYNSNVNSNNNEHNHFEKVSNLKKNMAKKTKTLNNLDLIRNKIYKIEQNILNKHKLKQNTIKKMISSYSGRNKSSTKEMNNKMKFENIKKNLKKRDGIDLICDNKKTSLKVYFRNPPQIPRISTKLTMKNIQSLKVKKDNKNIIIPYNIKKICRIQSVWRGIHIRKLYLYFLDLNKFINIIISVIIIFKKKYFIKLLRAYNNFFVSRIKYSDYLKHFNSNINIMNSDKFIIVKNPSLKPVYRMIKNNSLSLIYKRKVIKEICHNESINIKENKTMNKKSKNNIFIITKDLPTEIKAVKTKKSFERCIMEKQKDPIIIIANKNKNKNHNNKTINLLNIINQHFINEKINPESSEHKKQITLFSPVTTDNDLFVGKADFDGIKKNKNKNYNINNEIDIRESLEINPIEMKRTKNNRNNIFINNENQIEILNDKESIFTEKAKINMMKIILPIRLKTILYEFIKKHIFKFLIIKLRRIAFVSHLMVVDGKYLNNGKRYAFEKLKKINTLFYKNFFLKHSARMKIYKLLNDYSILKWNQALKEFASFIINNK